MLLPRVTGRVPRRVPGTCDCAFSPPLCDQRRVSPFSSAIKIQATRTAIAERAIPPRPRARIRSAIPPFPYRTWWAHTLTPIRTCQSMVDRGSSCRMNRPMHRLAVNDARRAAVAPSYAHPMPAVNGASVVDARQALRAPHRAIGAVIRALGGCSTRARSRRPWVDGTARKRPDSGRPAPGIAPPAQAARTACIDEQRAIGACTMLRLGASLRR